MAHDEFNSGARHGFNMALYAVRSVDRQIEYPRVNSSNKDDKLLVYNAQKDLLHKIYKEIKKEMEQEVHENDY
tara:strand:+ start:1946 stop:2164 length:219 start_codon:yes stop_codon:yes gene_type:complete